MPSYGYLNAQGKMLYGDAFPNGKIPLKSILYETTLLGKKPFRDEVYHIDIRQLTEKQIDAIIMIVARSTNTPTLRIRESFFELGFIPIRASMVETVGTDDLHLFV